MLSIDGKKWLIFTENEVNILTNSIENSKYKNSFISHKKDIKKFLLNHFRKNEVKSDTNILSDISKLLTTFTKTNNSTHIKVKVKEKKVSKNEPKNGYKILSVSNNYTFPSTIYKKKDVDEVAKSVVKGIIKKNKLNDVNANFSFIIIKNTKKYNYSYKCKKIHKII